MDRGKLFELINLALDIQETSDGEDGFPFVSVNMANHSSLNQTRIEMMDNGYRFGGPYDGCYVFKNDGEISNRVYDNCLKHLEELKERAEGF